MIDIAEWTGIATLTCFAIAIAWIVGRALWGAPEDGGSEWESALTPLPALPPSPVEVIRIAPLPVQHVGASEITPLLGAIGTLAAKVSDDLLTFAEQVAGDADEWAWFQAAMVAYEDALLMRQGWVEVRTSETVGKPLTLRDMAFPDVKLTLVHESTQQRIDRWLSEGGRGVEHARSEVRQAVSETWDSPSRELALVDCPDAERVAEAALTA